MELFLIIPIFLFILLIVVSVKRKQIKKLNQVKNLLKNEIEKLEEEKKIVEEGNKAIEEERRVIQEEKTKIETVYTELKRNKEQLEYKNSDLIQQINTNNNMLQNLILNGNQSARASVDAFTSEYLRRKLEEVATAKEDAVKECELYREQLQNELTPLKNEVAEYVKKKEAIIEARKREEELKNQLEFHRIRLDENSIEDIKYIRSILNRLSKPDVVAKVVWEVYIQGPTKEMLNRVVGKDKKTGIYRITNIQTDECYVGQGTDVAKRLAEHVKGTLGIQSIADQKIHHAMAETGVQNWSFELLEECEKEELNSREKFYINYYRSNEFGYNKTVGG